jgi:peptide deformylase
MKIVHYPHPALRWNAKPLTSIDKKIHLNVAKMFDLMYEARGLALAATQVGLPYRLLVMNLAGDPELKDQEEVFINPTVVEREGMVGDEEGCLSFPGLFQKVYRPKTVKVVAYNLKGDSVQITADDIAARCWLHEIDHLNGKLFIDKDP